MMGIIKWTLLFLAIFFLATSEGFSQTGTIRGFVYDKETGEPIIFTNVYLFKTPYGASTDVNGYFTISRVPDGNYSLLVTYLGFDTLREQVLIKGNTVITKKLFLSKASYALEGISISAERFHPLEGRLTLLNIYRCYQVLSSLVTRVGSCIFEEARRFKIR
ncbi:MAG: carboxypeptidase-like regulatory domain-containing protein [Bacteroidales bacterium]|nr:carboxypeptidase-like regulatory domain-containing protein [Bacteroidales bacterium]